MIDQAAMKIVFDWWLTIIVSPISCALFSFSAWGCYKKSITADYGADETWGIAALSCGSFACFAALILIVNLCTVSHVLYPESAAVHYLLSR